MRKKIASTSLLLMLLFILFNLTYCKNSKNIHINSVVQTNEPHDNISSSEKIEFGRKLFFDKRLSIDNTISCSSCHIPELAFSDGKVVSVGVEGRKTSRNAPTILNSKYLPTVLFDGFLPTLEMQVIVPIQEHNEMDINMLQLILKLREIPEYQKLAKKIFNREVDAWVITRAISAYERSLESLNARFDDFYTNGNKNALNKEELKGWELFSGRLNCVKCHPAPLFTNFKPLNNGAFDDYELDAGRFRVTLDSSDIGKFKVPTLRNIELTGPYMHNGEYATLNDVIKRYKVGGSNHSTKSDLIQPFKISQKEEQYLISFMKSLTDTTYMKEYR